LCWLLGAQTAWEAVQHWHEHVEYLAWHGVGHTFSCVGVGALGGQPVLVNGYAREGLPLIPSIPKCTSVVPEWACGQVETRGLQILCHAWLVCNV